MKENCDKLKQNHKINKRISFKNIGLFIIDMTKKKLIK